MPIVRDHRKLRVFRNADALAIEAYRRTRGFPREEQFGLQSQIRRAAVSVAANIVQGSARGAPKDYVRFLQISFGSCRELQYLLSLADKLKLLTDSDRAVLAPQCEVVLAELYQLMEGVERQRDVRL